MADGNYETVIELDFDEQLIRNSLVRPPLRASGASSDRARFRKRKFEVEVALHDGLTGALIARHRFDRLAEGDVRVGRDKPFASAAFFATDFGKAAEAIFHAVSEAVASDLDTLPFTARIVRKKGRDIFLDAGATSRIAPGDSFVAYHRKNDLPVTGLDNHADYGITETPAATVSIRQVQPLFSIGELADDAGDAVLQAGDIVRFESNMKK